MLVAARASQPVRPCPRVRVRVRVWVCVYRLALVVVFLVYLPTHNREPYDTQLSDTISTDPSVELMPLSSPVYLPCKSRVAVCIHGNLKPPEWRLQRPSWSWPERTSRRVRSDLVPAVAPYQRSPLP